ncbi:CAP domain-containing protein [Borrelia crocidurae]|uniref:CAP domain-containing protein n=1 Tax=Borrelia crocidurae TaxID=29520 RepID=UPI00058AC920|nr:CAP domain-containing protein [Borrelia crocidurae]
MQKKIPIIILFLTSQCALIGTNKDLAFLYSDIHKLRDNLNLKKLEIDQTLETVAKEYAINLDKNDVLTHTLFGTTPMQRVSKYDKNFCRIREILAAKMEVQDVTDAWLQSPKHKEALINKDTSKIGGYVLRTKDNKNIFVVLFGEKCKKI